MFLRLKRWTVWLLATVVLEGVACVGTRLVTGQWVVGWPFDVAAILGGYFLARRAYPLLPPHRGDGQVPAEG